MADETFEVELRIDLNAPNLRGELSRALGDLNNGVTGFDKKINGVQTALNKTQGSAQKAAASLSTTRYALYDVASTLGIAGAAMLAFSTLTTGVAIAWEKDFAQVIRTTGVTGEAVGVLREDLVELAKSMPVSFSDLSQIATLAGQLGVAQENIAGFTETVAKFSAVTDLTVDAAATAFGRLDALLPDVQGNYEALGSAIAKVGVESVATESQIVAISTQISSMGAFAGLTASEVVGLSGALASIGAAPEISRGTLTRLFSEMDEAIADGGESLQGFATIAGVSSDEFAASFGTNRFGPIFQSFIEGLADMERNGGNARMALTDLGITSVRDVPLLLRLAGAGDLLANSFADAAEGFGNATELNRQYAIIADTAAAQLQRLLNNFQALMDAMGSASLGTLTDGISFLADALGNLSDVFATDLGGRLATFLVVVGAVAGALGLAAAALALFGASSIGMQQGLAGIITMAPRASAAILGAGTAASIASGEMKAATIGAKALGVALKALSLVGVVLLLPDIAEWADQGVRALQGISNETDEVMDRLFDPKFFNNGLKDIAMDGSFQAIGRALGDIASRGYGDIKRADEELAAQVRNGFVKEASEQYDALQQKWLDTGGTLEGFKAAFIDTTAALDGSRVAATNGVDTFESLDQAMQYTEEQAQATQEALDALRDALLNFGSASINAEQAEIAFQSALNQMNEAAGVAEAQLAGTNAESLALRTSFLDMNEAALQSAAAIIENGGSMEQATAKYLAGREAIIQARIAKGEDRAEAEAWADAVLGSSEEAQSAIQAYIDKVNQVEETKTTRLYVDASGAYRDVDSLVSYINSRTATMTITQRTIYESSVLSGGRGHLVPGAATGGQILGPGTSTSDSIPVRLSNGEFVMKAAAVQKYGTQFMHAINSGRVQKFASGGQVGGGSATTTMGGVIELGPRSLKAISTTVTNNIVLDDVAISRASQRGDAKRRANGEI